MTKTSNTKYWAILSPGNIKTGDTASFDIPPITTCPGATELCKRLCYAVSLHYKPVVANKYAHNYSFSLDANFAPYMIRRIPCNATFRIHVSGDFYSAEYVRKWIEIATRRKDVVFYCYTRSWRITDIWRQILKFGRLPNVAVNVSCDKETGKPKRSCIPFRWCYMSTDDTAPKWLRRQDLIFRTNHSARVGNHQWKRQHAIDNGQDPNLVAPLLHRMGQTPICPFERGQKLVDFSCSQCRICMK